MEKAVFTLTNPISEEEALRLPPMSLAFIGDGVQSLYVRTAVTIGSQSKTGVLHKEVTQVVKAVAQAKTVDLIFDKFTEVEHDIFRRTRNCKIQTSAKHAEMSEYRKASGFEAVLGYLYLTGKTERLIEFLDLAFKENLC